LSIISEKEERLKNMSDVQETFDFEEKDTEKEEKILSNLQMTRPLVFFDLETTGLDVRQDRIIQFAFVRINTDRSREEWAELVNPGIPIPVEASRVHQITDEMVKDKPTFDYFAPKIKEFLTGCDLAGFNVARFDVPFLQAEMERCGCPLDLDQIRIIDAQVIYHRKEPRDLSAAYRFYCHSELAGAHDALVDVRATVEILDAQLKKYSDVPKDPQTLHSYCNATSDRWVTQDRKFYWRNGEAVISFGKHRGKSLKWLQENEPDYLEWMKDSDFSDETKSLIEDAIKGIFPRKEESD